MHALHAAMVAMVPCAVEASESCISFTGSLAVIHSVCRHSTYVRSLESATPVLCDATSSCSIDQHRCRAGSTASAVQKRNANSVSDAKQAAPDHAAHAKQAIFPHGHETGVFVLLCDVRYRWKALSMGFPSVYSMPCQSDMASHRI